jgi:hypothetical protein
MHHRRAQEPFPAIARGVSHGGGQTVRPAKYCAHAPTHPPLQEPGELRNNIANTQLTDELLAHEYFCRLAGFANSEYSFPSAPNDL